MISDGKLRDGAGSASLIVCCCMREVVYLFCWRLLECSCLKKGFVLKRYCALFPYVLALGGDVNA